MPDADGVHWRVDICHCIVNCKSGSDRAARRVYVEGYWFRRGVGFKEEELSNDGGGQGVIHLAIEADDAFLKELGEDIGLGILAGIVQDLLNRWYIQVLHPPP